MLPNKPQSTEAEALLAPPSLSLPEAPELSAPGKVFILGEYAVLGGAPAVVAAVGPRFHLSAQPQEADGFGGCRGSSFHPQSPAARLLDWADEVGSTPLDFCFVDPYPELCGGAGGFGASTAQFALAYRALAEEARWDSSCRQWEKVWKLYRELTRAAGGLPPSGADLVAQWQGGVVIFEDRSPLPPQCESVGKCFDWRSVLVFSAAAQAGRKVATHAHLAALSEGGAFGALVEALRVPLLKGIRAIRENHQSGLGAAMVEYAETLRGAGLELPATTEDRRVLGTLPGVLGVKGAGALQADAVIVLMQDAEEDPRAADRRARVIEEARLRDLVLVADGIDLEPGVL